MRDKTPKGNAEYMSRLNKIKVINLIRERGEISRAEIVKETGLSAPTITRIVESLITIDKLVIQERIGDSSGGRPPMMVRFNADVSYVVGIDWGRTHILGVLSDLNGNTLYKLDVLTTSSGDFDLDLIKVFDLVENLITQSNIDQKRIKGVGIAVAAYVNKETSIIEFAPNFGWKGVDVKSPFTKRFDVPVIVESVSRVMAQGELMYGIGREFKDFIFVNVGYGIGSGIISNGEIFYGYDGYAGEIGHTRITGFSAGRQCACGKYDCLECYSSGRGLAETAKAQIEQHPESALAKYENITAKEITEAANNGDSLALEILSQAADSLGVSIASMLNLFNPEAVILGGAVVRSNDYFISKVRESLEREVLRNTTRKIQLLETSLQGEAAVKGAIALILNEILHFRDLT